MEKLKYFILLVFFTGLGYCNESTLGKTLLPTNTSKVKIANVPLFLNNRYFQNRYGIGLYATAEKETSWAAVLSSIVERYNIDFISQGTLIKKHDSGHFRSMPPYRLESILEDNYRLRVNSRSVVSKDDTERVISNGGVVIGVVSPHKNIPYYTYTIIVRCYDSKNREDVWDPNDRRIYYTSSMASLFEVDADDVLIMLVEKR